MEQVKDPLIEWNRLNRSNAENDVADALFVGTLSGTHQIDRFSSWLLAGIGATAALFVTGISSILPYLSETGFYIGGAVLVASGVFGLLSKLRALQAQVALAQILELKERLGPVLDRHEEQEEKIQEHARQRGISLETEIDINRVVSIYLEAFPRILHKRLIREFNDGVADRHASLKKATRSLFYQGVFAGLQSISFVAFIVVSVAFASAI